jgi:hypothetical protein
MRQRWNGSIQSSNTPTINQEGNQRDDYGMYRCMVIDILYIDDPKNISKNARNPEVLYEVVILGGAATGQTLSYCRLASYLDGDTNYSERILKKTSKDISKVKLSEHDGDIVYVIFNQGHDAYPTIIGLARGLNQKIGAKKADGPRFIESYNGFETLINNKGELNLTMLTGKTDDGTGFFKASDAPLIIEKWASEESITRTYKSGLVILEDGKSDKVVVTTKGGLTATIDGKGDKGEIKTAGGVTASFDGTSNKISLKAGSAEVTIDGGSGKISIKGDMVDLGSSVSDFVTLFTQLATAWSTHTHIGNLGAPTSPPMAPLLTSVGSQTVKVAP